jgi:hypothetical protein
VTESSLPTNVNTGVINGRIVTAQKAAAGSTVVSVPMVGSVTFTPSPQRLLDATAAPPEIIAAIPVTVTLDAAGGLSVTLIGTDDTDLNPSGWTYLVTFNLTGAKMDPFSITVPVGSTQDLAALAPVASSGGASIVRGVGVPPAGTTGQVLTKLSNADDDTGWATPSAGNVLSTTSVKTANYTAAANELVPVDATSAARTVTWPTNPPDKTLETVKKIDSSTNAVTINCGGSDVFNKAGGVTTASLTLTNQALTAQYDASRHVWTVVGEDLPLTALDTRYPVLDTGGRVPITRAATGSTITVRKDPTTGFWPVSYNTDGTPVYTGGSTSAGVRPTSSANVTCRWTGADPSPAIVSSGTGGMLDNVDMRDVTS